MTAESCSHRQYRSPRSTVTGRKPARSPGSQITGSCPLMVDHLSASRAGRARSSVYTLVDSGSATGSHASPTHACNHIGSLALRGTTSPVGGTRPVPGPRPRCPRGNHAAGPQRTGPAAGVDDLDGVVGPVGWWIVTKTRISNLTTRAIRVRSPLRPSTAKTSPTRGPFRLPGPGVPQGFPPRFHRHERSHRHGRNGQPSGHGVQRLEQPRPVDQRTAGTESARGRCTENACRTTG